MRNLETSISKRGWILLLIGLSILVLIHQNFLLNHFSFKLTDSDQTILWLAAQDIADRKFYTPYFYGQSYNIQLEAFLGAGFLKLGLPAQKAVPLAGNLLGFIPWVCVFFLGLLRKSYALSALALVAYLIQPVEFHMVGAMARGFSNGLAVFFIGVLFLFGSSRKWVKSMGFLFIFLSPLINPNIVVVGLPVGLYAFVHELKDWKKYLLPVLIPALMVVGVFISLSKFNAAHPTYDLHRFKGLNFEFGRILEAFTDGYRFFKGLAPLLYELGVVIWLVLIGVLFWMWPKKDIRWHFIGFLIFFVLTLGINKVHDGTSSIFFPYLRMYLGLPFVLLFFSFLRCNGQYTYRRLWIIASLGILGFCVQMTSFFGRLDRALKTNSGVVQVKFIEDLCLACDDIENLQKKYQASVLVFHSKADEYNYGCKALNDSLQTVHPDYERRIWSYKKIMREQHRKVLLFDWFGKLDDVDAPYLQKLNESYPVYLLQDYPETLESFYKVHHLDLREYTEEHVGIETRH